MVICQCYYSQCELYYNQAISGTANTQISTTRILFLPPKQQCQSNKGSLHHIHIIFYSDDICHILHF